MNHRNMWELSESGWWTHPKHGCIGREKDGRWYFYPRHKVTSWPFKTLKEAMDFAEKLNQTKNL